MLAGIYAAKPGPRPPKHPWRESFAAIRAALKKAERLAGKERTHALVRVCRAFEAADSDDAPGWRIDRKGNGVRAVTAETCAFDKANRALDRKVHDVVGRCLSCFAMENGLPEDSLIDLIRDEEAGRLRGRRTKLAEVERKTGLAFERSEGWWVVSIWGVLGAQTRGRTLRDAFASLQWLLSDFLQMHRDGAWGPSGPFRPRLSARSRAVIARTLAIKLPPPRRRARTTTPRRR
jgi:hypothetical protein